MYKNQVDNDKKDTKVLKRIINEISLKKIIKNIILKKLLIYHGLIIQHYLTKLVMMLLVDTIKIKNHSNYYLFKKNLDNINNEYIKDKKNALKNFEDLKNNVKSKELKDIVKELERSIFGYDYENKELSGSGLKI